MYAIIIVIHITACAILVASILLQSGRGGGLSGLFGAGSTQTLFGTRAPTFLTRVTTFAAVAFLLTCISLTVLSSRKARSLMSGAPQPGMVGEQLPGSAPQGIPVEVEKEQSAESEPQPQLPQE